MRPQETKEHAGEARAKETQGEPRRSQRKPKEAQGVAQASPREPRGEPQGRVMGSCAWSRREGDAPTVLAEAFIQVAPFFKLYALYCSNFEHALAMLAKSRDKHAGFAELLDTQSALPRCRGLTLESYLIKPVQRLTK